MNTIIKPVEDNYDKQNTYVVLNDKLTKAKEEGYYYESMFIVYAMIEDRLSSILYYLKATIQNEKKTVFNPENKNIMKEIFFRENNIDKDRFHFDFNKVSHKRLMLETLIKWSQKTPTESKLHEDTKKILKDTENYLTTLKDLDKWCDYRNQLIHDIFNKNMQSVNDEIKEQIDKGYKVARELINLANNVRNRSKNV